MGERIKCYDSRRSEAFNEQQQQPQRPSVAGSRSAGIGTERIIDSSSEHPILR